jgi:hypothetical protein
MLKVTTALPRFFAVDVLVHARVVVPHAQGLCAVVPLPTWEQLLSYADGLALQLGKLMMFS